MKTSPVRTYIRGKVVALEEDLTHEFKGHRTISIENRISIRQGLAGEQEYSNTRQQWSKYLCGMFNTGRGGTLYGGIQDDGSVSGFMMSEYQQDHVRIQLEDLFERFTPRVSSDQYTVRFVPVVDEGDSYVPDPSLADPATKALDHKIRSWHRCWCDEASAASHDFGMFLPFYVIEVEIKPQQENILYRAEDGCCYQRQHGSTTNLDHFETNNVKDFYRQVCGRCGSAGHNARDCDQDKESKITCYKCGETGHRAMECIPDYKRKQDSPQPYCMECETHGHWIRMCPKLK